MREDIAEKLSHEITFNAKMLNKLSTLAALERYKSIGFINAISLYFTDLFRLQFLYYNIKKNMNEAGLSKLKKKEILHKAKNEIVLSRRIGMLQTMQKLFKYWHIAHLPFAIAMFVIMVIHVIVTVVFGYRWIL
jgi:hypothetical protein